MDLSRAHPGSGPTALPLFSVLLPSRNRLGLLKHAIASALRQDFDDFEVVVSDNASSEDYGGYVAALADPRVRFLRSDVPLHVTENWNRALAAARGRYIVMLGDDDALSPGFLARLAALAEQFSEPDVLYSMAYHYAYPGVFPNAEGGFLAAIKPRPIDDGGSQPHWQDVAEARRYGQLALRFRHLFGFNSQYFAWHRAFIERLSGDGPFFQSPYPDFYAAFMTMLTAERMIVSPDPGIMIGISPQSFGFYFHNDQLAAGNDMLMLSEHDAASVSDLSPEAAAALEFPGSSHYRNWLIAALFVLKRLGADPQRWIDYRRYRRIQLFETAFQRTYRRAGHGAIPRDLRARLTPHEHRLFDRLSWSLAAIRRTGSLTPDAAHDGLFALHRIYPPAAVTHCPIGTHAHIGDAWNWLAANAGTGASPPRPAEAVTVAPAPRASMSRFVRSWTRHVLRPGRL